MNTIPFKFKGKGKEFFKIWIVNILLTIITLGIYSAWAKVRTYRYIYSNTYLNNSNFEFNADPKKILLGRVIVVAFYIIFILATDIAQLPIVSLGIFIIFLLLLPWLIRQAISFKLKNTSYRNIHFKYKGRVIDFYKVGILFLLAIFLPLFIFGASLNIIHQDYLLLILLSLLIVFWIITIPSLYRAFKSITIDNSYYGKAKFGKAKFNFYAKEREVIGLFVKVFLISLIWFALFSFVGFIIKIIMFNLINTNIDFQLLQPFIVAISLILYLIIVSSFKGLVDGFFSDFIRNHTKLEGYKFSSTIKAHTLSFISLTNALSIIFTLGLAYPWAKMRYLRYKLENTYFECDDYDKFIGDGREDSSAIGEETMDFFDIDIGF